ncbi:MAG: 50S ribosomal protein L25 [Anaerolineae bacterium]|nr:50S ribosomal protein L25 [Anaerolineae bacterium]
MERVELKAASRSIVGKQVKGLRRDGWIPAVVFGAKIDSFPIKVDARDLAKALAHAGSTSLIDLYVDDGKEPHVVLARGIQRDILTSHLQHVDFYQVQLDHKVKTSPRLEVVGVSPLVESGEAVLVQVLNQLEVECLPGDLIDSIEVDVSSLETFDDSVLISDLPVPSGVTIMADPGDVVVSVVRPRAALALEEEEAELAELEMEMVEPGEVEELPEDYEEEAE